MAAWPSRASEPVISDPTSVKLALTDDDEMVDPLENELGTVYVPLPFLGMTRSS